MTRSSIIKDEALRRYVNEKGYHLSPDAAEALEGHVLEVVDEACRYTEGMYARRVKGLFVRMAVKRLRL